MVCFTSPPLGVIMMLPAKTRELQYSHLGIVEWAMAL
jgi:hypothetical protein